MHLHVLKFEDALIQANYTRHAELAMSRLVSK